jgi:hypothetical protein
MMARNTTGRLEGRSVAPPSFKLSVRDHTTSTSSILLMSYCLQCWILGDTCENVFTVRVNDLKTIDELKQCICNTRKLEKDGLVLWRVKIPVADLDTTL